ncbi:high mobility group protein Z [Limnobaculum parvum]|uniref:High mobility group protein Z n=1 Tax=Limnobaculum parvum TaxID=2172103 RepID=A0A2Y9TZU7_9GAMM|nr:high mobility group protein Z [Limnobaculum parvum]
MQFVFLLPGLILACYLVWLLGKLLWLNQLKLGWRSAKTPGIRTGSAIKNVNRPSGRQKNKTE